MRSTFVGLGELGERDLEAWRDLAEVAVVANPFHHPDFVLPAAEALGETEEVSILQTTGRGSEWTAALPVRRYTRWHRLPHPCIANWSHPYSFLGAPLIRPGAGAGGMASLTAAMSGRTGFAGLDLLPDELTPEAGSAVELNSFERAVLHRRDESDYLSPHVSKKHQRDYRRLARLLGESFDEPIEVVDRAQEPGGIEAFLTLEASGWKGREGTAIASNPAHGRFFESVARSFAARGALQLLFLQSGARVIAARCSLMAGDVSFSFKIAFDEELKSFSPGRELELRSMQRFHEAGDLAWMDSCAQPGNDYINRLWPDRRRLTAQGIFGSGPRGRIVRVGALAAQRVRARRAAAA